MKILLVEDEEILIKVLQEKLEKEGFTVDLATNGEVVLFLAKKFRPDLILLDIVLPKKNGLEVLRDLKEDPVLKNIPVIILSNLGEDEKIKKALSMGAVDYMVKAQHPINEVMDKIKSYLIQPK
ncbi:MAG: response regulator [Candidatus Paceibacterota bacterium]